MAAATALAPEDAAVRWAAGAIGLCALTVLALGLAVRVPQLAAVSVALVAGAYAVGLVADDATLDVRSPLYATALLLTCELALWSHSLRTSTPGDPGMAARHAAWLGILLLAALALGAILVALVDVARTESLAVDALGAAAALAAIAFLWRAVRPLERSE